MTTNNIHLVDSGREFASKIDIHTAIIDIVRNMADLTEALAAEIKRCEALAAENAALKHAMSVTLEHVSVMDIGQAGVAAMIINDALHNSETPATDAFLAEVRASELDSLAGVAETMLVKFANQNASQIPEAKGWEMIQRQASHRAAQLRGNSNGGAL